VREINLQMRIVDRIAAFVELGKRIKELNAAELEELQWNAKNVNNWFTGESINNALAGICVILQPEKIEQWLKNYTISTEITNLRIGLMMAGNIPAVGFHDLLCVLLAGHIASVKLSSSDTVLMNWIISQLIQIDSRFSSRIEIVEMLKNRDGYIATGSSNSARYFNYYFGKYPHIIRQNRTSVAVFSGDETANDYLKVGNDIFQYFGLGCRNVSKIYIKDELQLQEFLGVIQVYESTALHHKYNNNYDYNKSILLVNRENHLDNGFLILQKSENLVSPIAVLFFECYSDEEQLKELIASNESKIQCIVSKDAKFPNSIPFGTTQRPNPWDYADGVDTLKFLVQLV
jgi:hypothetical protein